MVGDGAAMAQVGNHLAARTGGRRPGLQRAGSRPRRGEGTSHHSDATKLRVGKASEEDWPSMRNFRRQSRNPMRVHCDHTEVGTDTTRQNMDRGGRPRAPGGATVSRGGNSGDWGPVTCPSALLVCVQSPGVFHIYAFCKLLFKLVTT